MRIYAKTAFRPVDVTFRCESKDELDRLAALVSNGSVGEYLCLANWDEAGGECLEGVGADCEKYFKPDVNKMLRQFDNEDDG